MLEIEKMREYIEHKQYAKIRNEVLEMNEADIAAMLEELELPGTELIKVFRMLPKSIAADVFSFLPIEVEQTIITSLTDREAATIIDNLFADDAADLMEEMPANVVKRLLTQTTPETRRDINHLLQYPEDSAGSIMTVEFVDLKEGYTVEQAIERIRRVGIDKETINTCYVTNQHRKIKGTISLRMLLLSDANAKIGDLMEENVITISTRMDQEEVARQFQKYDFDAMPVVDSENRLVGIITVDDVMDIIEQEATEDIEMMAAITPTDKPYMKTSVIETFRKRIPWLLFLMISATFTSKIIQGYESALASYAVLTMYIPMFMDTGGNAGGQASVTIIRSISLGEVEFRDIFRVMWKEIRVAVLCGVTLSIVNFAKLLILDHVGMQVAIIVCLTMVVTVIVAKIVGCVLPMLAKQIGFDPAVMASPFITTIVDAVSLVIYFQIATRMLGI
ncbi:MAG: magnesium transporter [Lachnospiraceae bacterium]|nr:magnesium transporter [Lachnospiraceae bacterium]MDD7078583.1 magnesium transporter [Lachnospiraceae bacterium]MDY3731366.1 magnesium transporter [Candidatus Choladocola sp.]